MSNSVSGWSCYRCTRSTGRFNNACVLCKTCWDAIAAAGLRWCNQCKRAVSRFVRAQHCCQACATKRATRHQPRANERRRERYHADRDYRERRKAEARAQASAQNYKRRMLYQPAPVPPTCEAEILTHLRVFRLTTWELQRATGFAFGTVRNQLWELHKQGIIRRQGNRRWVYEVTG